MSQHNERSVGALLGLALGEASYYRNPSRGDEEKHPLTVRREAPRLNELTHLSSYVARAVLSYRQSHSQFSSEAFGHAVAQHLQLWVVDPMTTATATMSSLLPQS